MALLARIRDRCCPHAIQSLSIREPSFAFLTSSSPNTRPVPVTLTCPKIRHTSSHRRTLVSLCARLFLPFALSTFRHSIPHASSVHVGIQTSFTPLGGTPNGDNRY